MSATLTFDQMERRADRTFAVALWTRHVRSWLGCVVSFAILHYTLRTLLHSVDATGQLTALKEDQASELADKLRGVHAQLMYVLDLPEMADLKKKTIFSSFIGSLEEDTEDLYDVIENLAFSTNREFRSLISDCVQHLSSSVTQQESVGCL